MIDRIPRSQIQLKTLQAAQSSLESAGVKAFEAIPAAARAGFVQAVQQALPGLPAEAVRDVLQAEWAKGNESLLSSLKRGPLRELFARADRASAAGEPRPAGTHSPLGVRIAQATAPTGAPFWHRTSAEGPFGP